MIIRLHHKNEPQQNHPLKQKYLVIILSIFLFSCSEGDDIPLPQSNLQSGVVLTFDDDFIDEWVAVNTVLQPYDWRATFFVTRFDKLSASQIQSLKDLKMYGHEIGGHGLNHSNAQTFISTNGASAYLNQEIFPMQTLMNANDLTPTSFAYPFGSRNATTDNLLLNEFQIVRGTTYGNGAASSQNCFYKNSRVVFGLGIDKNYSHFSMPYFISLLEYAKKNNKIVIFYAHKPVLTVQNNYETDYQTLIDICTYVINNDMKFYNISELYHLRTTI